jgi:hypothetical protein
MCGCDDVCIFECNIFSTALDANGQRHWLGIHSVLTRRPPGQQQTKQRAMVDIGGVTHNPINASHRLDPAPEGHSHRRR